MILVFACIRFVCWKTMTQQESSFEEQYLTDKDDLERRQVFHRLLGLFRSCRKITNTVHGLPQCHSQKSCMIHIRVITAGPWKIIFLILIVQRFTKTFRWTASLSDRQRTWLPNWWWRCAAERFGESCTIKIMKMIRQGPTVKCSDHVGAIE